MPYFLRSTFVRWIPKFLVAGTAWTASAPDAAVTAKAFDTAQAFQSTHGRAVTAARFRLSQPHPLPQAADLHMVELRVTACRRDRCREVSLLYDGHQMTVLACMTVGQQEAARWQSMNPAWKIKRWSCGVVRSTEKTI